MCPSVTTDLHTDKRAKTDCLRGRKMCPSVATDLHTGERANTGCLGGRKIFPSVATDIMCPSVVQEAVLCPSLNTHRRKSKDSRLMSQSVTTDLNT